jgi:hypothetical protein
MHVLSSKVYAVDFDEIWYWESVPKVVKHTSFWFMSFKYKPCFHNGKIEILFLFFCVIAHHVKEFICNMNYSC